MLAMVPSDERRRLLFEEGVVCASKVHRHRMASLVEQGRRGPVIRYEDDLVVFVAVCRGVRQVAQSPRPRNASVAYGSAVTQVPGASAVVMATGGVFGNCGKKSTLKETLTTFQTTRTQNAVVLFLEKQKESSSALIVIDLLTLFIMFSK